MTTIAMSDEIRAAYLRDIARSFRSYKALGDAALAKAPDAHLHTELDASSNSIAVIAKHVGGNLRSRYRDFLTTDGEKPDRRRDQEFEMPEAVSRDEIHRWWNDGWSIALGLVGALAAGRLMASLLYRVSPRDPVVFVATTTILLVVALAACWLPARRAARLNPLDALRAE